MIARILCWLIGHARGKRVNVIDGVVTFRCARCMTTWTRKER